MEFLDYVVALRRQLKLIIGLTILGAIVGGVVMALTPSTYRSTSSVVLHAQDTQDPAVLSPLASYMDSQVATYAELVTKPIVLEPVVANLSTDVAVPDLAQRVTASTPADTLVIDIAVTDTDPALAAEAADALAASLSRVVTNLTPQVGPTVDTPAVTMTTVAQAAVPETGTGPHPLLGIVSGALAGMFLGLLFAVVRYATGMAPERTGLPIVPRQRAPQDMDEYSSASSTAHHPV